MSRARKIRLKLGGSANVEDEFPERPRGMHARTYNRLSHSYDRFGAQIASGNDQFIERLYRRLNR